VSTARVLQKGGVAALLLFSFLPAEAARVYYVNQPENGFGRINAVKPDGTGHATLYTTPVVTDLRGIAVDPAGSRLFYAHANSDPITLARTQISIRMIPAAGGNPLTLATFPDGTFIADVEWDELNGWVYFAQTGDQQLRRMKPDGAELTTVLTTIGSDQGPYFFGLDLVANNAYWGIGTVPNQTNTAFSRGSLLTGLVDPAFTLVTTSRTRDIAVDATVPGGMLYWCDRQDGAVHSRAVEGGPWRTVRTGLNAPHGLVLDVEAGKGYVADTGKRGSGLQPSARRVVRFNLDGTGALELLSPSDNLAEPWDLAIDLTTVNYEDWKTRFFSSTALTAGPGDDPDGDSLPNFAEYAFFTHPEKPDASRAVVKVEGRKFQYARRRTSDISVRVEISTDLQTWHWNGETPGAVWTAEISVLPRDADSEWVTVEPAPGLAGEAKVFYRLRAQQLSTAETSITAQAPVVRKRTLKRARR
jgi:DNA-binding beta-propeller fold protein YncE